MVAFLRDVLGMRVEFERVTTTELSLPSDDRVQVFGRAIRTTSYSSGRRAVRWRSSKSTTCMPLAEPIEGDDAWEWTNVVAPDGNLYELASRRAMP